MRGHRVLGRPIAITLMASLLLAACGDTVDEVEDAIEEPAAADDAEEAEDDAADQDTDNEESDPADEAADEAADDAGEGAQAEDDIDPFEPGTVLEATYLVEFVGPGPVPCPQVELDDGQRIGVMSAPTPRGDDGRPPIPVFLTDVDGSILLVQPEDWVDVGMPEGEVVVSEGDRVRLTSAGSFPLEFNPSRAGCGEPDDDLLLYETIEAIS